MRTTTACWVIAACAACSNGDRAPLTATERANLPGVIYFILEVDGQPAAHRLSPDGTKPIALAPNEAFDRAPQRCRSYPYGASPDGRTIALVISKDGVDQIVIARPDGSNARAAAPSSSGVSWYPKYSPDGAWILFESNRDSFRDLYKVAVAGGAPIRLTNNREGNFDGAWSPDGKLIAFSSSRHGQLDLFVMNASDGSDQRRLTQHPGDSIKASWSPDGELIAFISGRDGRDNAFIIRPDGGALENVTPGRDEVESMAWRRDSRALVIAARDLKNKSKLRIVDVTSKEITALSGAAHNDSHGAWSPDGRFLAFASSENGHSDIWLMRADGTNRTRLTHDPAGAWLPRWLDVDEADEQRTALERTSDDPSGT